MGRRPLIVSKKPCVKCGTFERYVNRGCVECAKKRDRRAGLASHNPRHKPCIRCGEDNRTKNGRCRVCLEKKKTEGCKKCGSVDRTFKGACRPCKNIASTAWRFGGLLTAQQYRAILAEQNGCCAICRQECPSGRNLAVDHDHQSNKIRGLLCCNCNRGIGLFKDKPERLKAAAQYLEKNG